MIFRAENITQLADIWLRVSLIAHGFVSGDYWRANYAAMRDIYLPASENYIHMDDSTGVVTGFISLRDGWIEALFVDTDAQGKGVGRALLGHAKALYPKLALAVYERNERAVGFYMRNGFIIQERRTDPNVSEPELVMVYG